MKSLLIIITFVMQYCMLIAKEHDIFRLEKDVAQYKGSDYSNVVQVERNISLKEAFDIAEANSEIDYFVYTKGYQMILEIPPDIQFDSSSDPFNLVSERIFTYDSGKKGYGYCRIFKQGDTVFFKKDGIWLGSAPSLADTYFKEL